MSYPRSSPTASQSSNNRYTAQYPPASAPTSSSQPAASPSAASTINNNNSHLPQLRHKQIYRMSALGKALVRSLTVLVNEKDLNYDEAFACLDSYDSSFLQQIQHQTDVKCRMNGRLRHYRDCEGLWTFECEDVKVDSYGSDEITHVDIPRCKVVATESQQLLASRAGRSRGGIESYRAGS